MAQPSMQVRIAANIAELKRNLTEGKDQIEAVRAGFTKLATSFQGDKIIQAAHNAAAAVESIGGASRLTEAEQARVNATVERALAKYAALGREAPQALRDLAAATQKTEERTGLLAGAMGKLVAAFSVAAVGQMIGKVLDLTGKLTDLSGKTGITTEGLQVLQFTLGQSGVTMEQAANAAVKMGRNLVEGDKGAANAVKTLHLNVQDLIASGPEAAFLAIGSAIAAVPDPMQRAALATEIFGKSGADLLPGFTTNMAKLGDEARRSGAIISGDLVAAGDAAGDSWTRLQSSGMALIANVFLPLAPGIEAIVGWLATALPAALNASREGIDWLVRKGLEMNVWLLDMAASITETVASVPVLGRVFGQTSGDVGTFRNMAQEAKDTLAAFVANGAQPATAAVTAAAPATAKYGETLHAVAGAAERVTVAVGAMQGPSADMLNLESRSIVETVKLDNALRAWANTNGAVLAPSIRQVNAALSEQSPIMATANLNWAGFAGSVQQHTAAAGTSTGGFMDTLKGLFGGGGSAGGEGGGSKMAQILGQIGPQFAAAFTGPGSASDKMKAFATQAAGTLMGMIPGVGPWLQAFSGPIVEGLTKLASKAKDILAGIFGGPSGTEVQQRSLVKQFEEDLAAGLTATQKLAAGGESWKETVIRVRDAYLAQGRTAAEAEADVKRLWESSKLGAGATAAAIADIKRKMDTAAEAGEDMANRVTDALNDIPRDIDININGNYNQNGEPPGFAHGSGGIRDFGRGTLVMLHGRERVQTEAQAQRTDSGGGGDASSAIDALRDMLKMELPIAMRDALLMGGR